jgi:protein Hikeshi
MSAPPPFGVIIPPLPVQTNPVAISPTQFAFTFSPNSSVSHLVVFLLPGTNIPLDTLAAIYVYLPSTASEFKLLGALSNDKQSAMFKIDNGRANTGSHTKPPNGVADDEMIDDEFSSATPIADGVFGDITLGISIEPVAIIAPQLAALESEPSGLTSSPQNALIPSSRRSTGPLQTKVLAQRIIKNAFNFLASFAGTAGAGDEEMVPLKSFRDWWSRFERRVENDPGFLEREIDG